MWIFTKQGFFSIVQKPDQKGSDMVTVRSRNKRDLINLSKVIGQHVIIENGGTDYEFRLICNKPSLKEFLANQVNDIEYSNFKHEIQIKDQERASIYSKIWVAMLGVTKPFKKKTAYSGVDNYRRQYGYGGYFDDGGIWREGN